MERTYWDKQTTDKPLFPELMWSRPENKQQAGKMLIIGGNLHGFAAPAEAFAESERSGVGSAHVLLPDAAKKLVGQTLPHIDYAPSTPSGSFSQKALAELLDGSQWADAVLVAGDLGRNSETAILLEKFVQKYSGQLTLTKDAVDYLTQLPETASRENTLLVLSFAQLQKLAASVGFTRAFTFGMDLLNFVETLHEFTQKHPVNIIVQHLEQLHTASQGRIVSTPFTEEIWRVKTAAHAAVWWLQNPAKSSEAFAAAVFELQK